MTKLDTITYRDSEALAQALFEYWMTPGTQRPVAMQSGTRRPKVAILLRYKDGSERMIVCATRRVASEAYRLFDRAVTEIKRLNDLARQGDPTGEVASFAGRYAATKAA